MKHAHAIPTTYAGRNYRSMLEAKWAAFFRSLYWVAEYEPFELEGWIPDFIVRGRLRNILVEVKPTTEIIPSVTAEMERATDGRNEELLLVGVCPWAEDGNVFVGWTAQRWPNDEGHPQHGKVSEWGRAPLGVWTGSGSVAKSNGQVVGFCHEGLSYHDRITGCYDGGSYGDGEFSASAIDAAWSDACNAVQWRRR